MNDETSNIEFEKKLKNKFIYLIIAIFVLFISTILNNSKVVMIKSGFIITIIVIAVIIACCSLLYKYFKGKDKVIYIYYQVCDFVTMLLTAVFAIQVITSYIFFPAPVEGISMADTLQDGDFVIVSVNDGVKRFEMVVMEVNEESNYLDQNTLENGDLVIKRVIGLPGDNLYFENGRLYINDQLVDQEFLENDVNSKNYFPFDKYKNTHDFDLDDLYNFYGNYYDKLVKKGNKYYIPEDYYFVMGDNRGVSFDSSSGLGLFHKTQIMGIPKYKIGFLYIKKLK